MALNDSSSNEKLYRFVSDPRHKETLSGRVQAACVTCRRKKIKCSGDVPCTTCEEKGIVCEGLTNRKRPKKNPGKHSSISSTPGERRSSQDTRSDDGTVSSKRNSFDYSFNKIDDTEAVLRRPTAHLKELGGENSFDSGYASGGHQDNTANRSPLPEARFPFAFDLSPSEKPSYENNPEMTPSADPPQTWDSNMRPTSASFATGLIADSDIGQSRTTMPATVTTKPVGWPDPGHQSNFWDDRCARGRAANKLITAAEALEQRALFLRRMASHPETHFVEETRRQTITFPIYSEGTAPQTLGPGPPPSPYDDQSLMLGENTSTSGLTPILQNFNPWCDIESGLPFTLDYQPSTNIASPTNPTNSRWPYTLGPYSLQSTTVVSQEPTDGLASINATAPDTRQHARSNRSQPQNPSGWLYPWPE